MGRTPRGQTRSRIYTFMRRRLLEGNPPTVREVQEHFGFRAVQTARQHLEALVEEGRLDVLRGKSRGYRLPVHSHPRSGAGGGENGMPEGQARHRGDERAKEDENEEGKSPDSRVTGRAEGSESEHDRSADKGSSRKLGHIYAFPTPPRPVPILGRVAAGPLTTALEDLEGYIPVDDEHPAEELFALRVRGESMIGAGILPGDLVVVRHQASASSGELVVAMVGEEATVKRLKIDGNRIGLYPENPTFDPIFPEGEGLRILGKVVEVRRRVR